MKRRQNFKGDFSIVHRFYKKQDGEQIQISVPSHVRIEYFTNEYAGRFIAERNVDTFTNCALSEDGMALIVNIALSRRGIGMGVMMYIITEYIADSNFPNNERIVSTPGETNILLWKGVSDDNDTEAVSDAVLQTMMFGYSAYSFAKENGYEGTEQEFGSDISNAISYVNNIYPYILEFVDNRSDPSTIRLLIKGNTQNIKDSGLQIYLLRNLSTRLCYRDDSDTGERIKHITHGWRHPKTGAWGNENDVPFQNCWNVDSNIISIDARVLSAFITTQYRINDTKPHHNPHEKTYYSPRRVHGFGFALYNTDGQRVSDICKIDITYSIYQDTHHFKSIRVLPG